MQNNFGVYTHEIKRNEEKENMNSKKYVKAVPGVVRDIWNADKSYEETFATYLDLHQGDIVLCETEGKIGFGFCTVSNTVPYFEKTKEITSELVCKVDFTEHFKRKDTKERIDVLNAEMDAKVRALQKLEIYKKLAEADPELKAMLDEYNQLTGAKDGPT